MRKERTLVERGAPGETKTARRTNRVAGALNQSGARSSGCLREADRPQERRARRQRWGNASSDMPLNALGREHGHHPDSRSRKGGEGKPSPPFFVPEVIG